MKVLGSGLCGLVFFTALFVPAASASVEESEVAQWLQRAEAAARHLNYRGIVEYDLGQRVEFSRIAHYQQGDSEYLRMESLNGLAREIVRMNSVIHCYIPGAKTVRIMPNSFRTAFPGLKQSHLKTFLENYNYSRGENERVAGREVLTVLFMPRDNYRYAHKFWIDRETGLILAAHLIDPSKSRTLERFVFADIEINVSLPDNFTMALPETPPDWKVERLGGDKVAAGKNGWRAMELPSGFSKLAEERQRFYNKKEPVNVLVYTDGLVAVSVFIEKDENSPAAPAVLAGITPVAALTDAGQQTSVPAYVRQSDGYRITAIGRVPHDTLRLIAQGVAHK